MPATVKTLPNTHAFTPQSSTPRGSFDSSASSSKTLPIEFTHSHRRHPRPADRLTNLRIHIAVIHAPRIGLSVGIVAVILVLVAAAAAADDEAAAATKCSHEGHVFTSVSSTPCKASPPPPTKPPQPQNATPTTAISVPR